MKKFKSLPLKSWECDTGVHLAQQYDRVRISKKEIKKEDTKQVGQMKGAHLSIPVMAMYYMKFECTGPISQLVTMGTAA